MQPIHNRQHRCLIIGMTSGVLDVTGGDMGCFCGVAEGKQRLEVTPPVAALDHKNGGAPVLQDGGGAAIVALEVEPVSTTKAVHPRPNDTDRHEQERLRAAIWDQVPAVQGKVRERCGRNAQW